MPDQAPETHVVSLGRALLVALPETMQDGMVNHLVSEIGDRIVATAVHRVLIDASRTRFIDSFMGKALAGIATMARLLGSETTLVGLRPEVAITLVELGMDLSAISTCLSVEMALEASGSGTG